MNCSASFIERLEPVSGRTALDQHKGGTPCSAGSTQASVLTSARCGERGTLRPPRPSSLLKTLQALLTEAFRHLEAARSGWERRVAMSVFDSPSAANKIAVASHESLAARGNPITARGIFRKRTT